MIGQSQDVFIELKKIGAREQKLVKEFMSLSRELGNSGEEEKKMIASQIDKIKEEINKIVNSYLSTIKKISLTQPLKKSQESNETVENKEKPKEKISFLEKRALKRFGETEKKSKIRKKKKPRSSVELANKLFFNYSEKLVKKYKFIELKKNLLKTNMQFIPENYISIVIFYTLASFIFSLFLLLFLTIFDLSLMAPFISLSKDSLLISLAKYLWIVIVFPLAVGLFGYYYPSLERKASEKKIDQELPFATIHMAAIAESMLNPKNIFEILLKTEEYDELKKEFTKLLNEINVHGINFVNALRNSAIKSPSANLTDLFNGLATTINSGGKLKEFFDKRSQTLLFEHKIAEERSAKVAETFMDIYISIVIAAPMILMLLLMIMNVSGIGLQLTPTMISVMMIAGVSVVNVAFLMFMQLKSTSVG